MESDGPKSNRWEAIKRYGIGYGVITGLTMPIALVLGGPGVFNTSELIASILGGTIGILLIPGFFAWLGKNDPPGRRFVLFLVLWFIVVVLVLMGRFS